MQGRHSSELAIISRVELEKEPSGHRAGCQEPASQYPTVQMIGVIEGSDAIPVNESTVRASGQ